MPDTREQNGELIAEIAQLRAERNAIVLAHNYQLGEVQDIADFVGDSLELSIKASRLPEYDVIVFCSVDFMAETAKLLSPEKMVLLPERTAKCPMAQMIEPEDLIALKAQHPGVPVVCYVNTSAAVKAESDICCTSANAVKVVNSVEGDEAIFIPDRCLGAWVQRHTDKRLVLYPGFCPTHNRIVPDHLRAMRAQHPKALALVHPECTAEVIDLADHVVSTGGMVRLVKENSAREFIIGTEEGLLHRLRKDNPDKQFYHVAPVALCPNMKKTRLETILWALRDLQHRIEVPEETAVPARRAIQRMLEIS